MMRPAVLRRVCDKKFAVHQCYTCNFDCRKDRFAGIISNLAPSPLNPVHAVRNFSFIKRHEKLLSTLMSTESKFCVLRHLNNISHNALAVSHHAPPKMKGQTLWARFISKANFEIYELKEEDLEEMFTKGSGPGGQSVQKTANCVVLKHKPTGIVVKCHQERSLEVNRRKARERLREMVDRKIHGENSYFAQKENLEREKIRKRKLQAKYKAEAKRALKLEKAAQREQSKNNSESEGANEELTHVEQTENGISQWKKDGKRALSIKISLAHSHVVPQCQQLGFDFHHAQPGYVLMVKWLPDEPNTFPEYANQYLGVAGFVVNSKNQVLVIQERYNLGMKHWKLPGGLADKGEGLAETAVREVKEETGVEAEFMSVLAFRHQHNFRWGCSDWYFICLMRPVTEDIVPCPREVAQCKWMDIDEYERDPSLTDANRHFVKCYREARKQGTWALTPTSVLSYNKKFYHDIYSIQSANQVTLYQYLYLSVIERHVGRVLGH
ncbi:hypothetical protein FSP39_011974 [Pinctada imbricata]|uniref:Nudix hydrolase domain-containing protein n=1 Tax=Pinctada imbricata TaxID=66713 RepID=A0AA88XGZ2_PINIB|nr:hypothetical protein FSP39_011974 [Pinctada imbricata]